MHLTRYSNTTANIFAHAKAATLFVSADDTSVALQACDKRADLPVKGCGEANCAATHCESEVFSLW